MPLGQSLPHVAAPPNELGALGLCHPVPLQVSPCLLPKGIFVMPEGLSPSECLTTHASRPR